MDTATEKQNNEEVSNPHEIRNGNVSRIILGLTELGNLAIDDFSINYGITRTITSLTIVEKAYNKTLGNIMNKYILKEKGNFLSVDGFYLFASASDKEEYQKNLDELNEGIVTAKYFTIKASDLKKITGVKGTTMAKFSELIIHDLDENN